MKGQRNTRNNNMETIEWEKEYKKELWKTIECAMEYKKNNMKNNYRRKASLARRPPPAAFALTFEKDISGNENYDIFY